MSVNPLTMQAVIQDGYGNPERVLRQAETEVPKVGASDVLIRVRATSVNTPDWAHVAGVPYIVRLAAGGLRRPRHPVRGTDVAGVVQAVGAQVAGLEPGDEVFGSTWGGRDGAFAQYAVVPATQLAPKPAGLPFTDAAASVMSGLTALRAMRDVARVSAGKRVLVNGASGGVGMMAVQVAKALGAEVTGVCGTRNIELVRSLGADHVIDYTKEDFTQGSQRYDVILDNVVNHPPKAVARVLAPGGTFMPNSLGFTGGLFAGLPRMGRAFLMGLGPTNVKFVTIAVTRENLTALGRLLESGEVKVVIAKTYPLDQAAAAITHMLGHHPGGKVAITV
jgi:NADPH:quinone reductase-like Zn-dependent oxidoreductase